MSHKSFLLFDPRTHVILGTVNAPSGPGEKWIAHTDKVDLTSVKFSESVRFNPHTMTIYGSDGSYVEPLPTAPCNPDKQLELPVPPNTTRKSWWKFWYS